nr:O-antigen ligase family protein [uncultured Vibrio sp.]
MKINNYNSVDIRIAITILLAAFLNFKNPAVGALLAFFLELCVINIIYSSDSLHGKPKLKTYRKNEIFTILIFIICITISTILLVIDSKNEEQTTFGLIRYTQIITHVIFIFILSAYFYYNNQNNKLFKPIPASITIAAIICMLDYLYNPDTIMSNNGFKLLVSYNIRQIGYIVMLGCLFCTTKLILSENNKNLSTIYILLFIVNCSFLFWLGGRGAILALLLSITLSILIVKREFIIKLKKLISTAFLVLFSYLVSIPFSVFSWNGANRFFVLSKNLDEPINKISSGRIALWEESISLISQKPLFGYGPEAHAFETKIGFLQPHNSLLQSLLEFGFIGTIPFLIMIIYIVKNATLNVIAKPTVNNLFSFGLINAILIHSLYSGPLYHATSMILVCIASAYIISVTLKRRSFSCIKNNSRKF